MGTSDISVRTIFENSDSAFFVTLSQWLDVDGRVLFLSQPPVYAINWLESPFSFHHFVLPLLFVFALWPGSLLRSFFDLFVRQS